eukprot:scaffold41391_cov16-Tisochrysis_lutea.AAC.2
MQASQGSGCQSDAGHPQWDHTVHAGSIGQTMTWGIFFGKPQASIQGGQPESEQGTEQGQNRQQGSKQVQNRTQCLTSCTLSQALALGCKCKQNHAFDTQEQEIPRVKLCYAPLCSVARCLANMLQKTMTTTQVGLLARSQANKHSLMQMRWQETWTTTSNDNNDTSFMLHARWQTQREANVFACIKHTCPGHPKPNDSCPHACVRPDLGLVVNLEEDKAQSVHQEACNLRDKML